MRAAQAIERDAVWGDLQRRLALAQRCLAILREEVPAELAQHLRTGGFDESGWSVLADNAAAAAKLRQLLPRLSAGLLAAGLSVPSLRIKVRPR